MIWYMWKIWQIWQIWQIWHIYKIWEIWHTAWCKNINMAHVYHVNVFPVTCYIKDLINFKIWKIWNLLINFIDLTFITHWQVGYIWEKNLFSLLEAHKKYTQWCISKMVVTHFFIFDPRARDTKGFIV